MKLQLRIFKNIFNLNIIKISILYYSTLLVYYLTVAFNDYRTIEDFNAIFGTFNTYFFYICLLIFNVSYFIVILYKFLNYESNNCASNIVHRFKVTKWYINKLILVILFIISTKIIQYIIFTGLNNFFPFNYFDFNFLVHNIALFLLIGLIFFNFNMFYYNIIYLVIICIIICIPNIYISLFIIMGLSLSVGPKIFNYKKILALSEFK